MMVGRNDPPSLRHDALHEVCHARRRHARRQARDRLSYARGTRLVNGNALIASMAASAFKRGVQLWLKSPMVEPRARGRSRHRRVVSREGQRIKVSAKRGVWCLRVAGSRRTTR